ncbi:MAG: hypothetical protein WCH46_09670 [bacterium]
MKRYFCLFGSLILVFLVGTLEAQLPDETPRGSWSASMGAGLDQALTNSMTGSIENYQAQLQSGKTTTAYPFSGVSASTVSVEAEVEYRSLKSPISLFSTLQLRNFSAGNNFRFSNPPSYSMSIASLTGGAQYVFGQIYQRWNFLLNFGLTINSITTSYRSGEFRSGFDSTINAVGSRIGFEFGIGERYHFRRSPFGIDAILTYSMLNLFGKTYETPILEVGRRNGTTQNINDAKNPADATDNSRAINLLRFRTGVRYYF